MKEFFEFIKNIWNNKRTRSLAILIVYFIFFLFVFSLISSNNKDTNDKFYYLNNIEIISYNAYDATNNIIQNYNKELVSGNVIYKLVKNSTLESTNYIDNSNTYYISIKDYEKIINNTSVEIDGGVRITVSDDNIILDFTNYYGYKINIDIRS